MKVWELISLLSNCEAGIDVRIQVGDMEPPIATAFEVYPGCVEIKADDAMVIDAASGNPVLLSQIVHQEE